jgi:lysophospholipase L1-like esterase
MAGTLNGVSVRINQSGFRGPDILPKKPGVVRIVVFGDSIAFGQGVSEDLTLSAQLQKKLRARYPAREWEAINAGVRGYNMTDYVIIFGSRILPLGPDLLVLALTEINDPEQGHFSPRSAKLERWGNAWWSGLPFIKPLLAYPAAEEINRLFIAHVHEIYDPGRAEWPAFVERMRGIAQASKQAHVPLMVVTFPYLDDTDVFAEQRALLHRMLTDLGVPWVDPRPALSSRPASELVVSRNDFHPNALALGITADLLVAPVAELVK